MALFSYFLRKYLCIWIKIRTFAPKSDFLYMRMRVKRNTKIVFMAALLLLVSLPSWSQYRRRRGGLADGDHYHFGYVSGHVGYSILDTHATGVMPMGNVGGGVGVGYEYRNSGLWANIGVQYSMHRSELRLDPYTADHAGKMRLTGSTVLPGTMHYDVQQTDKIEWNFIDVPILFGYYTHGFSIGVGLKLSYALNPVSLTKGTYELSFSPNLYDATYKNMPERGLTTYEFETKQANRLNISAGLIGEIGYDLLSSVPTNSRLCHVLKLSFYFEYGLNNSNKGGDKSRFELPAPDDNGEARAKNVVFNAFLNTENSPARTVPFFAGAKITYMIGGSRTARSGFHHGCMCYQ